MCSAPRRTYSQEKQAGTKAVDGLGETQLCEELELGEAHAGTIEHGYQVADEQARDQPEGDLSVYRITPLHVADR